MVLSSARYDVVIGDGLLARAGALLAPVLPQKRAVVVTDETSRRCTCRPLLAGLAETGIAASHDHRAGRRSVEKSASPR